MCIRDRNSTSDWSAYFFTTFFTVGVTVVEQMASHRPVPLLLVCRKVQRAPASVSSPELSGASKSGVSVTSNALSVGTPTLSAFIWVAQARRSGVGVGAPAAASVQLAVLSEMMSMEPETGVVPPSPGFAVAVATVCLLYTSQMPNPLSLARISVQRDASSVSSLPLRVRSSALVSTIAAFTAPALLTPGARCVPQTCLLYTS